jgi:putative ABC transport system permease protein
MLKNYIKIAWRNMTHNKLYSALNICALALGMAVCMLILLYVAHEYSFDRFHKNSPRIFSVYNKSVYNGNTINSLHMDYDFATAIAKSDPLIESYLRVHKTFGTSPIISNPATTDKFAENKGWFADANFFQFFSFKLLHGDVKTALSQPFAFVISERLAHKYFGKENPIGKTLQFKLEESYPVKVTGVMRNMPSNTDFDADFIISLSSMGAIKENDIIQKGANFKTYFTLKDASYAPRVQQSIQRFFKQSQDFNGISLLNPLAKEHLAFNNTSASQYLDIFTLVAILILFLALVNYMSLSTARATARAKEIGIRKVTGASRQAVAMQFYVESALYALLAFVLACLLYALFQSYFFSLLHITIDELFLFSKFNLTIVTTLLFVTILVAGSYPSIILSAFKPIVTLSGKMNIHRGAWVRKCFTVVQFTISIALIICGMVIYQQLHFLRHMDTGVNRENIIMIPITKNFAGHYPAFKREVQNITGVKEVATARYTMYNAYDMFGGAVDDSQQPILFKMFTVDQNFIPLMGIKWKIPPVTDLSTFQPNKLIANETLLKKLNLPANSLGRKLGSEGQDIELAGVVKDFNFQSPSEPIDGLGIFIGQDTLSFWTNVGCSLFAKVEANTNLPTLISSLRSTYHKFDQENSFDYKFADDAFDAMFKAEERLADIFSLFISLTTAIAAMGLLGLATFSIQQRTKEIGIRKVLGSSVKSIVGLLSKDFIYLVLLSIVIATPVAWWSMNKWLEGFANRVEIEWWVFVVAALFTLVVALITISFQTIKAARANPVDSLRNE